MQGSSGNEIKGHYMSTTEDEANVNEEPSFVFDPESIVEMAFDP